MRKPSKKELDEITRRQYILHIARLTAEFTMVIGFIVIILLVLRQLGVI